jgi:hypothetical protein
VEREVPEKRGLEIKPAEINRFPASLRVYPMTKFIRLIDPGAVLAEEMIPNGGSFRCLVSVSNVTMQQFAEIEREVKALRPAYSATTIGYSPAPSKEEYYDDAAAYNFTEEPEYTFDEHPYYDDDVITYNS